MQFCERVEEWRSRQTHPHTYGLRRIFKDAMAPRYVTSYDSSPGYLVIAIEDIGRLLADFGEGGLRRQKGEAERRKRHSPQARGACAQYGLRAVKVCHDCVLGRTLTGRVLPGAGQSGRMKATKDAL